MILNINSRAHARIKLWHKCKILTVSYEKKKYLVCKWEISQPLKRKNGITKSANVKLLHGEWLKEGKNPPALSKSMINCIIRQT